MKRINGWLLLLALLATACKNDQTASKANDKVTVAVAASAQYALEAIKRAFERESDTSIELIVGSSGKLTTQILQGAPYDIFISADMNYPDTLDKAKLTTYQPQVYAYGSLVMWTCKDIDLSEGIHILNEPEIKKVAIANPETAPYGQAALDVMNSAKVYNLDLEAKMVYGESIAQTNQYITSGNCDLGFTAKSVVISPEMKGKGKWVELKAGYAPLPQGMVLLQKGYDRHPQGSVAFYNFVMSDQGRAILAEYGYQLPDKRFEPQER